MKTSVIAKLVLGVVAVLFGLLMVSECVTTVDADEIVVKQNVLDGHLQVWTDPGVHWQNFGRLTRYKKSRQFWFSVLEDEGTKVDQSIKVRFNDGGHGNVSGSLRYSLPLDPVKMLKVHSTFHSMESIDRDLIQQVVNKSVYMTGPLMSSRESYAEKRADLINFITDQIQSGVYRTERRTTKAVDLISGQDKTIDLVQPKLGNGPNGIEREEVSPIIIFGLTAFNITINNISYDPQVEEQIKQQQQATMAIQQAMVDSRKAEQAAITTKAQGEADAAKAKWIQEVEKAKAVTQAEQEKEVSALNLETAKLDKQRAITTAEGEAEAKKLAINADGALKVKLDAYVEVQKAWANAYGAQRQTPDIQFGNSGAKSNSVADIMQLWSARAAQELNVNPAPSKQ